MEPWIDYDRKTISQVSKGKGKGRAVAGHEDSEANWRYICTLFF